MNSEYRLEISNLSLIRGWRRVVNGFSNQIAAGQGLWLSGANGAGKTTLLRALAGFLPTEPGSIILSHNGHLLTSTDESYRNQILFLPAHAPVKTALTVREQWQLWQKIFNHKCEISAELNLAGHMEQRIGKLSAGQQRRLALALLTLANKKIWLLDEAFNHLDDAGIKWLRQTLNAHLVNGGIAIIAAPGPVLIDNFKVVNL